MAFDHKYVYHNFLMGLAAQPSFLAAAVAAAATISVATTAAVAAVSATTTIAEVEVGTVAQQSKSTATDGTDVNASTH
jgi:hypothetical protein